jgi:hypothetical protein
MSRTAWWWLPALLWWGCQVWKPTASTEYQPQALPVGPLTIGAWLPAGLAEFRFGPADQALLQGLGLNTLEWVQRAQRDSATAEELVMDFCNRAGLQLPVYYEPPGFTPYDKLRNWATRAEVDTAFAGQVRQRVGALRQHWTGSAGFWAYLVGHEDYDPRYYPALQAVLEVLRQEDNTRPAVAVGRLDHFRRPADFLAAFFPAAGPANIFQHEHYVFRAGVGAGGAPVQQALDQLARSYDLAAQKLQGRNGRWQAIIQAHGEWRDGEAYYRQPTAGELRVQAGMALARGASGIVYFLYSSGVEEILDEAGQVRARWTYQGLVDPQGQPGPAYAAVRQLNQELRPAGQALEALHFHGAYPSAQLRGQVLVRRADADLEFGVFGDGREATHVLVVNRRPDQARRLRLELRPGPVRDALADTLMGAGLGPLELEMAAGAFRLLDLRQDLP